LTTFERRQRLINMLFKEPGLRVPEMASRLGVSDATIRNDLNALAEAGQLTRVRGGATLSSQLHDKGPKIGFNENEAVKRQIARIAADQIEDRASIFLDASTTVYYITEYIDDRRNLTVITNGIPAAQRLARNPSNTVLLLGGAMHPDGNYTTGFLSEQLIQDLHVQTAYLSCDGFSLDAGLTERDIHNAHLNSKVIESANTTIALIDSTKFGKRYLTSFARSEQIAHVYTDNELGPDWIEQLKGTCIGLTICGSDTVSVFSPCTPERKHYRIGFANLSEQIPFSVDVRRSLERAVKEAGNIDLVLADNQLDPTTALEVAEHFASQDLDLVIEYQIDEQMGNRIMDIFRQKGIPVIAVDIPMIGATFFGVDNYRAGYMAGVSLGNWLVTNWNKEFDCLLMLEEPRSGPQPAARIQGQLDGLQSVVGVVPREKQVHLNSGNTSEVSQASVSEALKRLHQLKRLAVISFNDDAAYGALKAAIQLRREADMVIVGQGADRRVRDEILRPNSRLIGSTSYMPERYGEKLTKLALEILSGQPVAPAVYVDHIFITRENINQYYPEAGQEPEQDTSSVFDVQLSLP
jgi:ribose transport system substrate-binding protein